MKWKKKIEFAQLNGEIRSDVDPEIMAESMTSIGMSMFKYLIMEETPEFVLDILKRQYAQFYSLIKL